MDSNQAEATSIMIAAHGDQQILTIYLADQPVFIIDPARPITRQAVPQRFRLADALKRVTGNSFDQIVDALEDLLVGLLPVQIILPRLR